MIAAAGHAISNMQNVNIADWNRQKKKWHFSRDLDDGDAIYLKAEAVPVENSSVNLVISLSLPIHLSRVRTDFPGLSCYQVNWGNGQPCYDRLCSSNKQDRIVAEILTYINNEILPTNTNLENLNIFIAAQASFLFRLDSALNQGHLPRITVHHYNPDHPERNHPWGVSFNGGLKNYELIR
jgi:hypothetical protein